MESKRSKKNGKSTRAVKEKAATANKLTESASAQRRLQEKNANKTRAGGRPIVPKAGVALIKVLENVRLSPDALRQFAGPAPDKRYFKGEERLRMEFPVPQLVTLRKAFDPDRFTKLLGAKLREQKVGFACQVNDRGISRATAQNGWARNPADGKVRWDAQTRMHIASASKFYTAVALGKLFHERGISFDARVKDYLPVHWGVGGKAYGMSFGNLLSHVAGLWTGACEYAEVKKDVAQASYAINEGWHYANGNFALLRILIPIIAGSLDRHIDYGRVLFPMLRNQTDVAWDILTRKHFHDYMQANIWRPAGVAYAGLRSSKALWNLPPFFNFPHITNAAIGYGYPPVSDNTRGVDISEDLTASSGAVGWHVSCEEMLAAAGHIRRSGKVIPKTLLKQMFDKHYGIFATHGNDHATLDYHDGVWGGSGVAEWSYLGFVGTRYEIAVLSNNERTTEGRPSLRWLRDIVHESFDESFA